LRHGFDSCDSDGDREEEDTEQAWVFPDGLAVGKQVQYYKRFDRGFGRIHICCRKTSQNWAVGEVTEVKGNTVLFSWAGSAEQTERGQWKKTSPPTTQMKMAPSESKSDRGGGAEASFHNGSYLARRCDDYRISVPEKAWALLPRQLPRQAFPVTVTQCTFAEDGQLHVKVVSLGGGEMEFQLAEDSSVQALMQRVAEERQLGANVAVQVVAEDGAAIDPGSMLLQVAVEPGWTLVRASDDDR